MTDTPPDIEDGDHEDAGHEEDAAPAAKRRPRARPHADEAVIEAAFEAALSAQRLKRLHRAKARAVVIVVPAASWAAPTQTWLEATFGNRWRIVVRDAKPRPSLASSDGAAEVAKWLSGGSCVFGIATDPGLLPPNLVAAADDTIHLSARDPQALRRAIARFTGRSPAAVPQTVVAGLDLEHILAAMRPGSGPRRIVQRLELAATRGVSAVVAGDDVPDLDFAVEYGRAREWGLELAKGLELYRQGLLEFRDLPCGALLHGIPGTGKTLLSRAIAKKCNLPLFTTSVGDWFTDKGTYDDVIKSIARFMDAAIAASPSLAFIDEIDGIPNRETMSDGHNSSYWRPICNYTLTRLEASARSGVIVVAATNDLKSVDPALRRPGRLEVAIEIEPPDLAGTMNIIRFHAPELAESDLERVAAMAERRTGAELMYLVREGRRLARDAGRGLEAGDLLRVIVPPLTIGPAVLHRISIHEAGHAVATLALGYSVVKRVAVGTSGGRGGHSVSAALDDQAVTRAFIEAQATGLLAGRAAERILLGAASAGAGGGEGSDLALATGMLAAMHASTGLGGTLAYVAAPDRPLSSMDVPEVRAAVERDLQRLQRRADRLVARHRGAIEAIAGELAVRRHLDGAEVEALFEADRPDRGRRGKS